MTNNTDDLFEEMLNTKTPGNSSNSSEIDDLLANPFDQSQSDNNSTFSLNDAEILAQQHVTNEKLIQRLSKHRQAQAQDLAKQIDEDDMSAIIAYGANAQRKLSEFSKSVLNNVQIKDTGEIGDVLTDLMTKLQATNPKDLTTEPNLFKRLFGKVKQSINETQIRYQQIGSSIDRIAIRLEREKDELLNDNLILEQFYQKNKDYFEALNVYIAAGELKMEELQTKIIPTAIQHAKDTQDQMAIQKVHDLNQFLDRLDKRTHDLRLTRQMTIQQAPQLRLLQNTNQVLAEKIQSSIHTAIPLWENQITIALALLRQQQVATSQRMVSDTTNDLMLKNSEMLKQSTIDVARESERGVIDLETLKQTQHNLITALEETLQIQENGRQQRRLAENELRQMEDELHQKLLQISNDQKQHRQTQSESNNQ